MSKKVVLAAMISTAVAAGVTMNTAQAAPSEKCYGVSKAHMNDCAANGHSCAGQAVADNDANEWVYMPKGLCNKITGSSAKPKK